MDGGNGSVKTANWLLSKMPEPLRDICEAYRRDRCLPSFSYAVKELIETHPEIAKRINAMYDEQQTEHLEH